MSEVESRLHPVRIFCDFDGTISTKDIGYDLFDRFGCQEPYHGQLVRGELPIYQYWRSVAETLDGPIEGERLDEYLMTIPADEGYRRIVELARKYEVPITILSDGLSFYVERYLKLHNFPDVPVICNQAAFNQDGKLEISFPYAADGCSCPSAVCKRNQLLVGSAPDERIIYIGDGLSDFCPSECSDIIFAKGKLAAYCNANGLPHHSWKRLDEVARELERILSRRRIRGRHQAELARKRTWESG